ncbi:AAA family ATPase [uncultured Methanomethylovorans sp.]|uniref:AAA family ATPase n=1 Tax=uncultured Methanomethylovorans sp. TaxID=183759 RepID=UPI002AA8C61A|nr:AAA family ATPase [uncultured Methanomethylovorans sp.]
MTKILAFVGMPASGKSVAASILGESGIKVVNMGDVIREEVVRRGLEPTDINVGGVGTDLRNKEGKDIVAKRCIPKIRAADSRFLVVDGVRSLVEINCFKQAFGSDFTLVTIDAPLEIRFARVQARKRSDDMKDINALRIRDERELGWGMGEAIAAADIVIENTGTLEDFRKKVLNVVGQS